MFGYLPQRRAEDAELKKFEFRNSNFEILLGVLCVSAVNLPIFCGSAALGQTYGENHGKGFF